MSDIDSHPQAPDRIGLGAAGCGGCLALVAAALPVVAGLVTAFGWWVTGASGGDLGNALGRVAIYVVVTMSPFAVLLIALIGGSLAALALTRGRRFSGSLVLLAHVCLGLLALLALALHTLPMLR